MRDIERPPLVALLRRVRGLIGLIGLIGLASACGGSSATSPTPTPTPVPTPPPATYAVNGIVTATNGGQVLSGLAVDLNGSPTTTNGAGAFTYTLTTGTTSRLTLTGAGIVPRAVLLNAGAGRSVDVGAIALAGFDLEFYRRLVRNGFEGGNEPLRRWTRGPNVYLQTNGSDAASLTMVERVIREAVPAWTHGLTVGTVERGVGTREGESGWLTVKWPTTDDNHCGLASIGTEGGWLELRTVPGCGCNGWIARPSTVRHELGHALGFYHTDNTNDVMHASDRTCDKPITAREQYHAAIAYARPVGNVDPDDDTRTASVLSLPRATVH